MKMRKRAVSALVATVLLILITVAAVGIIWGAIMPMINQATQYGQACMNARFSIETQQGYTCYNATQKIVLIQVGRGAEDFVPIGMHLVLTGGGISKTFPINTTTNPNVWMLGNTTATDPIQIPGANEERTYVINAATMAITSEVSVAPIVKIGNTEKICDISSRAALTPCRAG